VLFHAKRKRICTAPANIKEVAKPEHS